MFENFKAKQLSKKQFFLALSLITILLLGGMFAYVESIYVGQVSEVWVYPPLHEASYVIGRYNSTYYYAKNGTTGNLDFLSSNASYVINSARNALGTLATGATGRIEVKKGTYQISSNITIGKKTHLICESGTVFNVTTDLVGGCIIIDKTNVTATDYLIEGLHIDMNQKNGHAIYSENGARTDSNAKCALRNIYIKNVKAGYGGITITNFFLTVASNIHIYTYGVGFWIKMDDRLEAGNSVVEQLWVGLSGNNAVGAQIESSANKHYVLLEFQRLQVIGGSTQTGTIGVNASDIAGCNFYGLNLEDCETCMILYGARQNAFYGCGIRSKTSTGYGVRILDGTIYGGGYSPLANEFFAGTINCSINLIAYSDESTSTSIKNRLVGTRVCTNWTLGSSTVCDGAYLSINGTYTRRQTRYGTVNTARDSEWFQHLLPTTPTRISITPINVTYGSPLSTIAIGVKASNTTHFQVRVYYANATAVTNDVIQFMWLASYKEEG